MGLEDGPEELARSQWTSGGPSYPQQLTDLVIKQKVIVLNTAASVVGNGSSELWKSTPFVQQPFGPHKLLRAFDTLLSRQKTTQETLLGQRAMSLPAIPSTQPLAVADVLFPTPTNCAQDPAQQPRSEVL